MRTVTGTTITTTTTTAATTNNNDSVIELQIINDPMEYIETTSQFDERIGTESEISREFHWLNFYTNDTHFNDVQWRSSPRYVPTSWSMRQLDCAMDFPEFFDVTHTTVDTSQTTIPHITPTSSVMATASDYDDDNGKPDMMDYYFNHQLNEQNEMYLDDDEFDHHIPVPPPPPSTPTQPGDEFVINFDEHSEQSTNYDGDNDDDDSQTTLRLGRQQRNRRRRQHRRPNFEESLPNKWFMKKCGLFVAFWLFLIWVIILVLLSILEKSHDTHNPASTTTSNHSQQQQHFNYTFDNNDHDGGE
ncbi:hypothetical protein BLA29_006104 [Euroglyphus maynei]|uniref:Uncharacterized protein n=1 Tax=Euroglyphus maynei TaxID=6958 RepID=A0A1Y3BV99_EURMA|nr:hypothetical protein BLA29_006104 [Euroglyphus maynei]